MFGQVCSQTSPPWVDAPQRWPSLPAPAPAGARAGPGLPCASFPTVDSHQWQELPSHSCLPLQVDQSGLGLPSRDYYLNKTENEKVSVLPREWLPATPHSVLPPWCPLGVHTCVGL